MQTRGEQHPYNTRCINKIYPWTTHVRLSYFKTRRISLTRVASNFTVVPTLKAAPIYTYIHTYTHTCVKKLLMLATFVCQEDISLTGVAPFEISTLKRRKTICTCKKRKRRIDSKLVEGGEKRRNGGESGMAL